MLRRATLRSRSCSPGHRAALGLSILLLAAASPIPLRAAGRAKAGGNAARLEPLARGSFLARVGLHDPAAALAAARGGALVDAIDRDPARVAAARRLASKRALAGRLFAARWDGGPLPWVDGIVNRLVVEKGSAVARSEILRVLAPRGVAILEGTDPPARIEAEWPAQIDEWTHYLHDSSGNAVARDARVAPPRRMRWLADPLWTRYHHSLASISSLVTARGRLFYLIDEGLAASLKAPAHWSLVARDAFNGLLLWKRPIPNWVDHRRRFRSGPVQLPRLLVASGDRLWAPLALDAPVSELDAATGEVRATLAGSERAEEIVLSQETLLVLCASGASEQALASAARRGGTLPAEKTLLALDARSRAARWSRKLRDQERPVPLTLAAAEGAVYYLDARGVTALDLASGEPRWGPAGARNAGDARGKDARPGAWKPGAGRPRATKRPGSKTRARARRPRGRAPGQSQATLVVEGGVVLCSSGGRLQALSSAGGRPLWSCRGPSGAWSPGDVFVIGGVVWLGPDFSEGRDLRSGRIVARSDAARLVWTVGHHHRCYREKATERFIVTGKRGVELLDIAGAEHFRNNWVRGVCQYGVLPANGLLYAPSDSCACYVEAKLNGFWALEGAETAAASAKSKASGEPAPSAGHPLEKGPAFGERSGGRGPSGAPTAAAETTANDRADNWPMHRHDRERSGSTSAELPEKLAEAWRVPIGGRLSAAVVADGAVIVASSDEGRVVCLDASSGAVRWSHAAGGRVDSAPTIHAGRVLFGSADGRVTSLRLADGALAWRLRAAPRERRTAVREQVESVWPVHGSVLIDGGLAWTAAGRSSYLDGGMVLLGIDPASGRIVRERRLATEAASSRHTPRDPATGELVAGGEKIDQNQTDAKTTAAPDRSDAFSMGGLKTDILSGDGSSLFLRLARFDRELRRIEEPARHLFTTSTFLDGLQSHRAHWVLGWGDFRRVPVAYSWIANREGGRNGVWLAEPYGEILAFAGRRVWGSRATPEGHFLFARDLAPEKAQEDAASSLASAHVDFRRREPGKDPVEAWRRRLPLRPRALVRAGSAVVVAGMPESATGEELEAADAGRRGGRLWIGSASDGKEILKRDLPSPPVWDGISVAAGRLLIALQSGELLALGGPR